MEYQSIVLKQDFVINEVFTVHYFEYMSDFFFPGETHDFWEILCVDKGEVEVTANDRLYTLKRGEIIFHKPNEFHNLKANGVIAPNLVVVSFSCNSPCMKFFEEKILTIGEAERTLLASIITETQKGFSSKIDDPYLSQLVRLKDPFSFGAEQLIKIYLEQLLIQLYRRYTNPMNVSPVSKSFKMKSDSDLYSRIITYLESNIDSHITVEQICKANLVGRSQLQKLFREKHNCGIIDYFSQMKVTAAKQMIREQHLNFTQIAETLGYNSIHYFSRQFKKISGMTPSEYASSIKSLAEAPEKLTESIMQTNTSDPIL